MRLNKDAQFGYNRYLDYLHLKASEALSLQVEAEEKVRNNEKIEIAKLMMLDNEPIEKIARYTGLSIEQIEELRKS
jgi:hypothetical protein